MKNAHASRFALSHSFLSSLPFYRSPLAVIACLLLGASFATGCGRDALNRQAPDSVGAERGDGSVDGARDGSADGFNDGATRTITSISVDPAAVTLVRGSMRALVVTAVYSDGTTGDVTSQATFSTSDAGIASLNGPVVTGVAQGIATVTATVGTLSRGAQITVTNATVMSIAVLPAMTTIAIGADVMFTADATLNDGTHQDITTSVTWTSSMAGVATVAATGVATGRAAGVSTITATFGTVSGRATLTVSRATLTSLQVAPVDPTVGTMTTLNFTATAIYSDGTRADVTAMATWTSSAPAIVTIDATGRAMTRARGTSTITAAFGGQTGTSTVTVTAATLVSIVVTPATATLLVGGTAALRATGTYSDGSMVDLTSSVVWSSTMPTIASVSNAAATAGTVTALAVGNTTVSATSGTINGQAMVTVSMARLISIVVSPTAASTPVGATVALTAQGFFSDMTSRDITTQVAWTSSATTVATVSNAAGTNGVATGVSVGTATITATLNMVTGTATVTVTAATLASITVAPANATTTVGLRSNYTATGNYSNGTTANLTAQVTWATGNAATAQISNVAGAQGQLLARAAGTTTVTATLNGVTGTTNVTVMGRVVTTLAIAPIAATTRLGTNIRFVATEIFSDGTQANVSAMAAWTSSMTGVATINTTNNRGLATPVAVGTTTITATFMGLTASTTLTVLPVPVITSISVTPIATTVQVPTVTQFTATAIFSDGTIQNVTQAATWVSSAPAVLAVTTAGARGRGTAVAPGTATVTATFMGISGSTTVTVTNPVIVQLLVSPAGLTLAVGQRRQFNATAIYSDGTSRDVTATSVWVSSQPAVAGVSDVAATRGQVTAVGAGMTNIQATFQGTTGQVALVVTAATLTTIQVTPFNRTLPVGVTLAYQATGILSDGTTVDLTAAATWTSSVPAVAGVSNAAATRGQVTAVAAGTTQISAASGGITGSTMLTVTSATLSSITITPANPTATVGGTVAFTATGTFSDGSTLDVTALVTWTSTNIMVGDVSNAAASRGQATAFATGTTTIQAQRGTVTATTTLTVN